MSLDNLIHVRDPVKDKEQEVQTMRDSIKEHLDPLRETIAFWRMYPDLFVDYLCSLNPHNTFHFYFYQRLFLRAIMRHKYVYATFVRAWSKSFMSVMGLLLKCILYPRASIFVVSGGEFLATI